MRIAVKMPQAGFPRITSKPPELFRPGLAKPLSKSQNSATVKVQAASLLHRPSRRWRAMPAFFDLRGPMRVQPSESHPVIVSASRSTDIPAFYPQWFVNRWKAGYAMWTNPFDQSRMKVCFDQAKAVVFWTKDPAPLIPHLDELEALGLKTYYFQVTLNDYEKESFEPNVPPLHERIGTFKKLSGRIGRERVIWRFDPLIMHEGLKAEDLVERIFRISKELMDHTDKLVFSFADVRNYRKVQGNLCRHGAYAQAGAAPGGDAPQALFTKENVLDAEISAENRLHIAQRLADMRGFWSKKGWDLTLATCAEDIDLRSLGIGHNSCIDGELLLKLAKEDGNTILVDFLQENLRAKKQKKGSGPRSLPLYPCATETDAGNKNMKDKGQRPACGCVESKDIGMYSTCSHFCVYCYANASREAVRRNQSRHSDGSESLAG